MTLLNSAVCLGALILCPTHLPAECLGPLTLKDALAFTCNHLIIVLKVEAVRARAAIAVHA